MDPDPVTKPDRFDQTSAALCFLLFLAAFLLRVDAVDYGYFHGDERINEAAKVLTGQLVPGQHFYPPFINYLNAVALGVLFALGLVADWWSSPGAFRDQYFADPTVFYVTARIVTALTGALLAPLFFGAARAVGLDRWRATGVGLIAVLFPLGVFMAHIAKGDTGLATALVAVFWAMLMRLHSPHPRRWDLVLGLCVTLTLSFKQSGVFVLFPLALGLVVLLARAAGWPQALRSLGRALLVVVVLLPVLNIGLLMDLRNFLDYQKIQAVMSLQTWQAGPLGGLATLLWRATLHPEFGMGPVLTGLTLLTPLLLLRRGCGLADRGALLVMWGSLALATVIVAVMAGPRQPEHLWIANFAGFMLLAGLALLDLTRAGARAVRAGAVAVLALVLVFGLLGVSVVLRQARAVPMRQTVSADLAASFATRKIVTSVVLDLPQMKEAQGIELARMDRLARKYNVTLPDMAEDRIIHSSAPDAVYYVNMPGVMFGLEGVSEDQIDYEVKAHAWPLQAEEWQLEYWLDQGFSVFAVQDFAEYAHVSPPVMRQDFYQAMQARCRLVRHYDPVKPLFLEREVTVFDCAAPQ